MGTTRGLVVPVKVTVREGAPLVLADRNLVTSHLTVTPLADPGLMPFPQEVWVDSNDIPVAFAVTKDGKQTTFYMSNYESVLAARQKPSPVVE